MYIVEYDDGFMPNQGKIYTVNDTEYWSWRYPDKLSLSNNPGGGLLKVPQPPKSKLNFTWNIIEYGESNILFQLNFTDPYEISSNLNYDSIVINVNDTSWFYSNNLDKELHRDHSVVEYKIMR